MRHILVVDDDPTNRDILQKVLTKEGLFVDEAAGGESAMQMIKTNNYDLIFLDLMMPDISGYDILNYIRQECNSQVAVIIVSAFSDVQSRNRALLLGANDYITKPINIQLLLTSMRCFLNE